MQIRLAVVLYSIEVLLRNLKGSTVYTIVCVVICRLVFFMLVCK